MPSSASPTITGIYQGNLNCELIHTQSGTQITTDAPVDNHGNGASLSPTDLCAASLGSCMATLMGIQAQMWNIPVGFQILGLLSAAWPRYVLPCTRLGTRLAQLAQNSNFSGLQSQYFQWLPVYTTHGHAF